MSAQTPFLRNGRRIETGTAVTKVGDAGLIFFCVEKEKKVVVIPENVRGNGEMREAFRKSGLENIAAPEGSNGRRSLPVLMFPVRSVDVRYTESGFMISAVCYSTVIFVQTMLSPLRMKVPPHPCGVVSVESMSAVRVSSMAPFVAPRS